MRLKEPRSWRGKRRWQPAVLGLWLTLLFPVVASAQTATDSPGRAIHEVVRVVIKSPCFDNDSLSDNIEEWLGRDIIDNRVTAIQVRASQGVLSFVIEVTGHPPTAREFPALPRDCIEQRSAIALSVALAVDALESDLTPIAAPSPPAFHLTGVALLTTPLPGAVGVGVGLSLEWRPLALVSARFGINAVTSARSQPLRDELEYRFGSRLLTTRTDLCFRLGDQSWEFATCGGFWWGALWTVAADQNGETSSHGWYAASGSVELRLLGDDGLGLLMGLDVIVPLRSATVAVVDASDAIYAWRKFPSVVGAVRVGPSLSF